MDEREREVNIAFNRAVFERVGAETVGSGDGDSLGEAVGSGVEVGSVTTLEESSAKAGVTKEVVAKLATKLMLISSAAALLLVGFMGLPCPALPVDCNL